MTIYEKGKTQSVYDGLDAKPIREMDCIEELRWRKVNKRRGCATCMRTIPPDSMRFVAEETGKTRHYCVPCGRKWGWDRLLGKGGAEDV